MTMQLSDKMQKELMETFEKELEDHLGILNNGLLTLEDAPSGPEREETLTNIFRSAHSLKGAARFVNLKDIEAIAHRMEDALGIIKGADVPFAAGHIDVFLSASDAIAAAMRAHKEGSFLPPDFREEIIARLSGIARGEAPPAPIGPRGESWGIDPGEGDKAPAPSLKMGDPGDASDAAIGLPSGIQGAMPPGAATPEIRKADPSRPVAVPAAGSGTGEDTIRVATAKLDALMDNLGELTVFRMRTEQLLDAMKAVEERMLRWQKNWRQVRPYYRRLKRLDAWGQPAGAARLLNFIDGNEREITSLGAEINTILAGLKNDSNYLHLVTDELENGIRKARMLPIAALFDIFPRMVRDLARDFEKDVVLEIMGQDTEVDRHVLEIMKDPLMHMVRNAIDHGIERGEERLAAGKSRYGTLRISAEQRGSNLLLMVADDGRGIDLAAVCHAAVEQGRLTKEQAAGLTVREVSELIFFSGLSTSKEVTDISGRGIGMDVVRGTLEQVRGQVRVETAPGRGTMFVLTLPLALAAGQALLVRTAGETLALPMTNVERMLRIMVEEVGNIEGRPAIYAEGRPLPLISLAAILGRQGEEAPLAAKAKIPVVIVSLAEKRVALRVDEFLSTRQIVVKSLGSQLRRVRNIAGVTILGDGRPAPVLNIADIMKAIHSRTAAVPPLPIAVREERRSHVLVVDDSITTRTLEKHILENAGYEVSAFVDGQEAWDWLRGHEQRLPDLVVSDIDMPRMNGFDLTEAIKGEDRFSRIPVVLVTSLADPQDRLRGLEAGADAYIVKTSFDQRELLEAVERLIL